MQIVAVHPSHACSEWDKGAHNLSKACEKSADEVTGDQLKMILARGERSLIAGQEDGVSVAWAVVQVQQLPNIRVLHIYSIYAPGHTTDEVFSQLADLAKKDGCSEIRGCVNDASARMWMNRFGAEVIHHTVRIRLGDKS